MCFPEPPDPPKVTSNPDSSLVKQRVQMELDQAALKKENKARRLEQAIAIHGGKIGRKSMFSGGKGGEGFAGKPANPGAARTDAYQPGPRVSLYSIPQVTPVADPGGGGGRGGRGGPRTPGNPFPNIRGTGTGANLMRFMIAQQMAANQ
jgi:hypothetical protein